ncbi:MAG: hypothetical protein KC800_12890 [Candidatus Eremiobacteraeota bacterium]|nr:hypothetical protein [Candidatus Eremiobacteraeota bacterium]
MVYSGNGGQVGRIPRLPGGGGHPGIDKGQGPHIDKGIDKGCGCKPNPRPHGPLPPGAQPFGQDGFQASGGMLREQTEGGAERGLGANGALQRAYS